MSVPGGKPGAGPDMDRARFDVTWRIREAKPGVLALQGGCDDSNPRKGGGEWAFLVRAQTTIWRCSLDEACDTARTLALLPSEFA